VEPYGRLRGHRFRKREGGRIPAAVVSKRKYIIGRNREKSERRGRMQGLRRAKTAAGKGSQKVEDLGEIWAVLARITLFQSGNGREESHAVNRQLTA